MGEYQPWVHSSGVPSVNLEDDFDVFELEYKDGLYRTYRIGNLIPEYDWGLYNGSRGSNPDNPNATGLYTYEGKELQGQWRTMRLEEAIYLLGIPALDNDITFNFDNSEPDLYDILKGTSGGYCILLRGSFYQRYPTPTIVDFPAFYYDYSANQWAYYEFLIESNQDGGTGNLYGWVKTTNISEDNYQVLNSRRYDSEGNPQYAYVTIIDQATMETVKGVAILPDNDNWDDPCKNESSTDGKIVKGWTSSSDIKNLYTKERWKFFMEPSGAVFIKDMTLNFQVSWLAPLSCQTESNSYDGRTFIYRNNVDDVSSPYGLNTSVNGKTIPLYMSDYGSTGQSPVYLVQEVNP